jgi:hypothetical protein
MKILKPRVKLSPKEEILGHKTNTAKLVDSNDKLSKGGRAYRWWIGKPVKKSDKYEADGYAGKLDQFEIIKTFSMKGFEYGNWLNNNDRHDCLEATAESLDNLSKTLGTKNIGCDGIVGIAFGARGKGGKGAALAHFEPSTFMINLTKEKGFGSLAHEYGHALDYFFGLFIDQSTSYSSLVGGRSLRLQIPEEGGVLRKLATRLVNNIIINNGDKSASYLIWEKFPGDYWIRRNEIFARTFEQWIRYKMDQKGLLVGLTAVFLLFIYEAISFTRFSINGSTRLKSAGCR